jgi:hypothetical protein
MCGGCGVAQADWLSGFLAAGYARTVVARYLAGLTGRAVTPHPGAWMMRDRTGRSRSFASFTALVTDLAGSGAVRLDWDDLGASVRELPPHRLVQISRGSVPEASRNVVGGASLFGDARPDTALYRLCALAIGTHATPQLVPRHTLLQDEEGEWAFALPRTV